MVFWSWHSIAPRHQIPPLVCVAFEVKRFSSRAWRGFHEGLAMIPHFHATTTTTRHRLSLSHALKWRILALWRDVVSHFMRQRQQPVEIRLRVTQYTTSISQIMCECVCMCVCVCKPVHFVLNFAPRPLSLSLSPPNSTMTSVFSIAPFV